MAEVVRPEDEGGVARRLEAGEKVSQVPSKTLPILSEVLLNLPPNSSESPVPKRKARTKEQRKWGDQAPTEFDMASLDYSLVSEATDGHQSTVDMSSLVDNESLGIRTQDGLYEVKDWEFAIHGERSTEDVIAEVLKKGGQEMKPTSGPLGALGSIFARLTGSKMLAEEDLKPVLEAMKQHLMKKNVAKEISEKVCEDVGQSLVGKKVGGFQSMLSTSCLLHQRANHVHPQQRRRQCARRSQTQSPVYSRRKRQPTFSYQFGQSCPRL